MAIPDKKLSRLVFLESRRLLLTFPAGDSYFISSIYLLLPISALVNFCCLNLTFCMQTCPLFLFLLWEDHTAFCGHSKRMIYNHICSVFRKMFERTTKNSRVFTFSFWYTPENKNGFETVGTFPWFPSVFIYFWQEVFKDPTVPPPPPKFSPPTHLINQKRVKMAKKYFDHIVICLLLNGWVKAVYYHE